MSHSKHRPDWIPGVKVKEAIVGSGPEAAQGRTITANVRMFLNRGDELFGLHGSGSRANIDLGKRTCISGLRYGIVGMRVGGRRNLTISPHLAYGSKGLVDRVPPNAVIHCEVDLLDVWDPAGPKMHATDR